MRVSRPVLTLILTLAVSTGASAGSRAAAPADLDAYVARVMQTFDVPAVSLAIVKDGQVIVAKGYGVRKLGDAAPADAQTLHTGGLPGYVQQAASARNTASAAIAAAREVRRHVQRSVVRRYRGRRSGWKAHDQVLSHTSADRRSRTLAVRLPGEMARPGIARRCVHHLRPHPGGTIERAKIVPASPSVDFSYDFQDLLLIPRRER